MDQRPHRDKAGETWLTVSASTPVELLRAGLQAVLDLVRAERAPASAPTAVAVPVRGLGADLDRLFLDLTDDLLRQVEEFGLGLDEIRLDGLLRTETGGYTAWGYLGGGAGDSARVSLELVADSVIVAAANAGFTLTWAVRAQPTSS